MRQFSPTFHDLLFVDTHREPIRSTECLPRPIRQAMLIALRSHWYSIEPDAWESATGVCPVVAAGKLAGVWRDGHLADGGPIWGSEESPSDEVFDFAVSFDLHADEVGTEAAVDLVERTLSDGLEGPSCAERRAA